MVHIVVAGLLALVSSVIAAWYYQFVGPVLLIMVVACLYGTTGKWFLVASVMWATMTLASLVVTGWHGFGLEALAIFSVILTGVFWGMYGLTRVAWIVDEPRPSSKKVPA